MLKKSNLSITLIFVMLFTAFISGCGGGGGTSPTPPGDEVLSKTGVAVDPYISNARFFIDSVTENGLKDTDEVISGFSNDSGEFEFSTDIKKGQKVRMHPDFKGKHNGIDYSGPLLEGTAEELDDKGRVVFSPLTTIVSKYNLSRQEVADMINSAFEFTSEITASHIISDPMAHLPQNSEEPDHEQLRILQAAIAVNGLLQLLEKPSVSNAISHDKKKEDIKKLLIPIASNIKSVLSVEKYKILNSLIPSGQPEFDIDTLVRTAVSVNNKTIDSILSLVSGPSVSGPTISELKTLIESNIDTDENSINTVKLGIATYITDNFNSITDKDTIISKAATEIINAGGEDPTPYLNSVTQNTIISDNTYNLTLTTDGNGTVTGAGLYSYGQTIEITAEPSTDYVFSDFREGDNIISQQNPFVYTMPSREVTLTAHFTINTQYNLNYSAGEGGIISGTATQTITHGSDGTTVTAVPDTGYRFVKWSDDVATPERTDTNITSGLTVIALFTGDFAGGTGTSEDPYQISTAAQLDNMRNIPGKYYKLTADIDLGVAPYNEGTGWQPIGNHENYFYGSLDGNNHTISNLTINNSEGEYLGLFGKVYLSDYIKNINLINVDISGKQYIGGLAGEIGAVTSQTPDVINCTVSGTITASGAGEAGGLIGKAGAGLTITNSSTDINITGQLVGGLVGNSEADITACHSAGTVTQTGSYEAGGLIGILKDADLTSSYSTANVNGYRLVGGLVGWVDSFAKDILIEFCYATGNINVNITTSGGGLIALVQNTGETTTVRNCYATGNLTGVNSDSELGGLIGKWADNEGSIINCYSIGHLSNANNLGGLISSNVGGATITSSYWDTVTSGQTTSEGGTGMTTADMSKETTFSDWDFTSTWSIDEGSSYPYFSQINKPNPSTYTLTVENDGNGTATGGGDYLAGLSVTITATPSTGYKFKNWTTSGGGSFNDATSASTTFTMPGEAVTITANFIKTYILTYNSGLNGSLTGITSQTVNHGSNGSEVTGVPSEGYHFVKWSDDVTANPRTDTNVTDNITVTAEFEINQYTLTYNGNDNTSGTAPVDSAALHIHNSEVTVKEIGDLSKTGYEFFSWNTDVSGNGDVYFEGQTFNITSDTILYAQWQKPLIIRINVTDASKAILIPLKTNNIYILWGDGSAIEHFTTDNPTHTFSLTGEYTIKIFGIANMLGFDDFELMEENTWHDFLVEIVSFGEIGITSLTRCLAGWSAFESSGGYSNDVILPNTIPSTVEDLSYMFYVNDNFNQDISSWDTSNVTNMSYMFQNNTVFNQDISNWDTSNVQNMSGMFQEANSFNQDISNWNTSNVTNMSYMFNGASFNQDISNWNTSNVTNMSYMFNGASFNQDISSWDTSNVTNMSGMFQQANSFNNDISDWNTSNVTNMSYMFKDNTVFNNGGFALDWTNGFGTDCDMSYMFSGASFNQDIGAWNVSNVKKMTEMFYNNTSFNQNIGNWVTTNLTDMASMFLGATSFNNGEASGSSNKPLLWDTSKVTSFSYLFYNTPFNQNIGNWNTSNVTNMDNVFHQAKKFNQDISNWNISKVTTMQSMFLNAIVFNQNLSNWNISSKNISNFDTGATSWEAINKPSFP